MARRSLRRAAANYDITVETALKDGLKVTAAPVEGGSADLQPAAFGRKASGDLCVQPGGSRRDLVEGLLTGHALFEVHPHVLC